MAGRTDIVTQNINDFYGNLNKWERKVFEEYGNFVRDEHFTSVTRHNINLKPILDALPPKIREGLMTEYKSIIGFRDAIAGGEPSIEVRAGARGASRFAIDPSKTIGPDADPRSVLFNRLYVQNREEGFDIGTNILRAGYLENLVGDLSANSAITAGKRRPTNIIVFDTETAGLTTELGSVRQVAAIKMTADLDASGNVAFGSPDQYFNEHFRTARMQYGYLAADQKLMPMNEALSAMYNINYGDAAPGSGDEFANRLRPFVQDLVDADHIAGQNVQFDLDQVLQNLSRTRMYQEDDSFKTLVDTARGRILEKGVVKDTLEILRAQHPDMPLARELKWAGEARPFSLENVMLQTNLAQLIRRDLGGGDAARGTQPLLDLLGASDKVNMMHAAENDTLIEAYLLKYLHTGELQQVRGPGMRLGSRTVAQQVRKAVLRSYAPTPISNIGDITHIHRDTFRAMFEEDKQLGRMGTDRASIRVMDRASKSGFMNFSKGNADDVYDYLSSQDAPFAKFRINPLEQEIHATRTLSTLKPLEDITDEQLIYGLGKWRNFAKPHVANQGILNRFSTLFKRGVRPEQESYRAMQGSMAEIGTPWAGLSLPERQITNAMSAASALPISVDLEGTKATSVLSLLEQKAAQVGDDIGISRFVAQRRAHITKAGRNISLPLELLRAAEEEGVLARGITGDDPFMFGVSGFKTPSGARQVNLTYGFAGDTVEARSAQAKSMADWMAGLGLDTKIGDTDTTLRTLGFGQTKLDRVLEALPTAGAERGIGVGFLNSKAGLAAFQALEDINQGILSDESALPLRAGLISHERGQVQVGGFVLDRMMDDGTKQAYAENLRLSQRRSRQLEDAVKIPKNWVAAKLMHETGHGEIIQRIMKGMDVVSKRFPLVAGGAALGATAYYLNKRRVEQNIYDETLSRQPAERSGYYGQYRREMGQSELPPVRFMPLDPLTTAGVTGQLDRGKIGHTSMDRKYDYLYGGIV